jgi:Transposase DDE domain
MIEAGNAVDEDWALLVSFFPANWKHLARLSGALKGLRQEKSEEQLIRVLLLHVGCGFSMRETVVRAKQANLAQLSAVALLKRLRKSKDWLYRLCCALFEERGFQLKPPLNHRLRLIDSTLAKEPGKTGSLWRIHYSFQWPTLACDYFKLTATQGNGTGDSLRHFPLRPQDYVLADRGYCQASGIHFAVRNQAYVTLRLNAGGIRLQEKKDKAASNLALAEKLHTVEKAGQIGQWQVFIPLEGSAPVPARLCVIRKSQAAIALAQKKLRRKASKQGAALQPETLFYAQYVMVLTTFPEDCPAELILEWYRFRWQIELAFKRFKQIAQLGHLPKYDEESAKAWLYGKLFVALLTEKLIAHACAVSPWGYLREVAAVAQPMA